MLFLLNARRGYRTISRGAESTGFPSFTPCVQPGPHITTQGGSDGACIGAGVGGVAYSDASERKRDLTAIMFERPYLREDESLSTSYWLESGPADEGATTMGGAAAAAENAKREMLNSSSLYMPAAVDSDGKPILTRTLTGETRDSDRQVSDTLGSAHGNFGVQSLPLAHVRVCFFFNFKVYSLFPSPLLTC